MFDLCHCQKQQKPSFIFYNINGRDVQRKNVVNNVDKSISPDKALKGVIYPLKTDIYALVGVSKRTFTR